MTNKEIRNKIKEIVAGLPEQQISAGIYIHTIGYKYLTIMDTMDETTLERIPLEYFDGQSIGAGIDEYRFT